MTKTPTNPTSNLRRDIIAGIIVFLVALPLCLGIAQASGAPPYAGIVAGIIGGIVVGFASRSAVSVAGPAAGLISIVAGALVMKGQPFSIFLCAVIVAGVFQLVLGFARAGGLANYLPSSVIEGMLGGIGLTIIIKELPNAVGFSRAAQTDVSTEGERGIYWPDLSQAMDHIDPAAAIIAALGLIILFGWMTKPMQRFKLIPAGLLVVVLAVVLNEVFRSSGAVPPLGGDRLVEVPVPKDFQSFLGQFTLPDPAGFLRADVWTTGLIIGVVASIESLLCIEATDKLDSLKRYTRGSGELKAQGLGNLVSGLIGGLPITTVIVRSSANINAGARTKVATITHGLLLLVCVATMSTIINRIPEAALSVILIFTGYRLCRPAVFLHMWKEGGATQFIPFVATVIIVPMYGLLQGVAIGLVLAVLFTLRQNLRIPYFYQRSVYNRGELIKISLSQEVSFLNKAAIKEMLEHLPEGSNVIIDASNTEYIDFDVLDIIREFGQTRADEKSISLSLVGFQEVYKVPNRCQVNELMGTFIDSSEVPRRSTGRHEALLKELRLRNSALAAH